MNNQSLSSPEGISLKEYVNDKFNNLEKSVATQVTSIQTATQAALDAADKALTKAEQASEKRFEGVNEFRATLQDQASRFVTRAEMDAKIEGMEKNRKDNTAFYLALLGILISIVSVVANFLIKI
jgi:hypothetical protein